VLDGVECRLQFLEAGSHLVSVGLEKMQPLVDRRVTSSDQGEVALDVAYGHRRGPKPGDEHHPVHVSLEIAPMTTRLAAHVQQPNALVIPQGVGAHTGLLDDRGNGECRFPDHERAHDDHGTTSSALEVNRREGIPGGRVELVGR
jgi:hypothetical protein